MCEQIYLAFCHTEEWRGLIHGSTLKVNTKFYKIEYLFIVVIADKAQHVS